MPQELPTSWSHTPSIVIASDTQISLKMRLAIVLLSLLANSGGFYSEGFPLGLVMGPAGLR